MHQVLPVTMEEKAPLVLQVKLEVMGSLVKLDHKDRKEDLVFREQLVKEVPREVQAKMEALVDQALLDQ